MACHFHAFKPHLRLWPRGRSCKQHRLLSNEANEFPPGLGTGEKSRGVFKTHWRLKNFNGLKVGSWSLGWAYVLDTQMSSVSLIPQLGVTKLDLLTKVLVDYCMWSLAVLHNLEPFGGPGQQSWLCQDFMEKMPMVVFGTLHKLSLGGCYNSTHKMLGNMLFVSTVSATWMSRLKLRINGL